MSFRRIKHSEIDFQKWNALVGKSSNATIFECAWYLNELCQWDVIVKGDYESGMAVPVIRKWGLNFHYQPAFIQQCRWLGNALNEAKIESLFAILKAHYFRSHFNSNLSTIDSNERPNFVLNLNGSFERIFENFGASRKRNIKRARKRNLTINSNFQSPEAIISIYRNTYGKMNSGLLDVDYQRFSTLLKKAHLNNNLVYREIHHENELHAAGVFLVFNKRMHYLMGASNKLGRESNALSLLFDDIIHTYADTEMTIDFEGSAIPSVAHFYQSFGSISEPFYENKFYGKGFWASIAKGIQP